MGLHGLAAVSVWFHSRVGRSSRARAAALTMEMEMQIVIVWFDTLLDTY